VAAQRRRLDFDYGKGRLLSLLGYWLPVRFEIFDVQANEVLSVGQRLFDRVAFRDAAG
jgi:hypothetical protein